MLLIITTAYSTLREKKMLTPNDHQHKVCLYLIVILFLKTNKQNKGHHELMYGHGEKLFHPWALIS